MGAVVTEELPGVAVEELVFLGKMVGKKATRRIGFQQGHKVLAQK